MDTFNEFITIEDLESIASGTDCLGNVSSAATMAVYDLENRGKILQNTILQNATISLFSSGGCVVIQADFIKEHLIYLKKVVSICEEWQNFSSDERKKKILSLVVVPLKLRGDIYLLYQDLVYFVTVPIENGSRLILCFDHLETQIVETDQIDYKAILTSIQAELKQQEDELLDELEQVNENFEQEDVQSYYDSDKNEIASDVQTEDLGYSMIRFTKEDTDADDKLY